MQVSPISRWWRQVFTCLIAIQLFTPTTCFSSENRLATLVSRVYQSYAWVAVFSISPPRNALPLAQASREELRGIFSPELAQAIWADAQCAQKRGEICLLDFEILFDSQDPSAVELTVRPGSHAGEVIACFKDIEGTQKCLTFLGKAVGRSTRVTDIIYPGHQSLRQVLGLPSK